MSDELGYVHSLTETEVSRKGNTRYFNFSLQTKKDVYTRGVCFHIPYRNSLKQFADSGTPVKLRNILRKPGFKDPSVLDIVVNKRCKVEQANNSDIDFESLTPVVSKPTVYTVKEALQLEAGELVSIEGRLTIDSSQIKEVQKSGEKHTVLNAAVITDDTGTIKITLWDSDTALPNEECYLFTNVKIKEFNGQTGLTTTPKTSTEKITADYPFVEAEILNTLENRRVEKILMVNDFITAYSCLNCRRNLTDVCNLHSVKCTNCQAIMLLACCKRVATVRIGINNAEKEDDEVLWLTLFNEQLKAMLTLANEQQSGNKITLFESSEEDVTRAILSLENLIIAYDTETAVVESTTLQ